MKITLCGSMAYHEEMERVGHELTVRGHEVLVPLLRIEVAERGGDRRMSIRDFLEKNGGVEAHPPEHQIWQEKRDAIRDHFEKVEWCDAVLVVNPPKNGIEGYVGGNTLIEIGLAFYLGKKVYVLNPISEKLSCKQEIVAMQTANLNGTIDVLR